MQIEKAYITLKLVRSLKVGNVCRYVDTRLVGFQLWIGTKTITYYLRKRKDGREFTVRLGSYPEMMPDEARNVAVSKLAAIDNSGDPDGISDRNPTLQSCLEYYISNHAKSESTKRNARLVIRHFERIMHVDVNSLTSDIVGREYNSLKLSAASSNTFLKILTAAVNLTCRRIGFAPPNFRFGITMKHAEPRRRYITEDETNAFFRELEKAKTSPHYMFADVITMLILTGARKTNVCNMKIENIHGNIWTIPAEEYKSGTAQDIPLGASELDIIRRYSQGRTSGYVFRHRGKRIDCTLARVLKTICCNAGMEDFRVHDLRRTIATWMLSNGVPVSVVSKKLGHASIRTTERVYAHVIPQVITEATDKTIEMIMKR